MKKVLSIIVAAVMAVSMLGACSSKAEGTTQAAETQPATTTAVETTEAQTTEETTEAESTGRVEGVTIKVAALNGPTGMGMAYLNKCSDNGETKYEYDVTYASAPDEITGSLINGELDIAAVPVNLASVLYNKTEGQILTAAVNTLGVLYIIEKGESINSFADLEGKKIVASGQASTPEYVLNYLLAKNELTDKVEVEYAPEHDAAVTAMANGDADIIMIPEPKVTTALSQIEGARIALNLTEEWDKVADARLVQGVIVVQKDFAQEHPEYLQEFLADYAASVQFTNDNKEEASEIIAQYGIIPKAPLALKAIPNCNIVCLTGDEMKAAVTDMLTVLFEAEAKSVGGKLPTDEMFCIIK